MASGDEVQIWIPPNAVLRERATVPGGAKIEETDGFIPAHYEYTREDGRRHYALTNSRYFQRILDGYACPECLAKFKWARNDCPLCPWERDLTQDIIDQVPQEWLPGPATVTNDN